MLSIEISHQDAGTLLAHVRMQIAQWRKPKRISLRNGAEDQLATLERFEKALATARPDLAR